MTQPTRRDTFAIGLGAVGSAGLAAGPAAAQGPAVAPADKPTLTLLLVNDIYKMGEERGRGGFARLAGVVKSERAKGVPMLYCHAGDCFSPSIMSGFDQGAHIVELLNTAPPDVFVPGNHEFDFGKDVYAQRRAESKFPYFAANLRAADGTALPGHEDARVVDLGPIKVGVFGVALAATPQVSTSGDLTFAPEMDTVRAQAAALRRAGADLVVAVTHTAFDTDIAIFRSRLVDVLLTGHDHDLRVSYDGRVAMVESGEEGQYVTAVDITAEARTVEGRRTVTWRPNFRVIDTAGIAPDPQAAEIVKRYEAELAAQLDVVIGRTAVELDSRSATVRSQEALIGNLVADAMRAATGADAAVTNGGGIRGNKVYASGTPITRRDILTELPFGNTTNLVEITGADLRAALENGLSQVENRAGRFPQVSGLRLVYDQARPAGSRIVSLEIGGREVDPAARYKIASNNFMVGGGDGYTALGRGRVLVGGTDGKLMASDVMTYVRTLGTIALQVEGRVIAR